VTLRVIAFLFVCISIAIGGNEPAPDPPIPITVGKVQTLEVAAGPIAIPIHCSPDGDLLLRTRKGWNDSLLYIDASTGKTHDLQFNDERISGKGLLDFLALGNGRANAMFAAQEKRGDSFKVLLASWDADGSLSRARTVEPGMHPWQFVTFPSNGNVLLAGTMLPESSQDQMGQARLELIDSNGQFIRWVDLNDGFKPPKMPASGADNKVTDAQRAAISEYDQKIAFSVLYLDDSGNAIFRRDDSGSPVYFISPAGEVIRKIKPPKAPKDGVLMEFRPARGRLLWRFVVSDPEQSIPGMKITTTSVYFVETDAETGGTIQTYLARDRSLLGPFGCYTPGAISLVSAANGRMQLITSDLR